MSSQDLTPLPPRVEGSFLQPGVVEDGITACNHQGVASRLGEVEEWSTCQFFIGDTSHIFFIFVDSNGSNSSAMCRSLNGTHIMMT